MNPHIIRFPPSVDMRMATDPKPPSIWYRILEAIAFPVMMTAIVYGVGWFMMGFTAWGQNGGIKCEIGYNPVTHLCADPYTSECSGWSPPGFCWSSR